jgi:hypothetical protein
MAFRSRWGITTITGMTMGTRMSTGIATITTTATGTTTATRRTPTPTIRWGRAPFTNRATNPKTTEAFLPLICLGLTRVARDLLT